MWSMLSAAALAQATEPRAAEPRAAESPAAPCAAEERDNEPTVVVDNRHGFRLGYTYYPDTTVLDEPHLFVMGYEMSQRLYGGGAIDVLIVENLLVSGLNQSLFIPSANLLVGASLQDTVEIGVGPNLSVLPEVTTNMIAAVGLTIPSGVFEIPVHLAWVSARDGWGRVGLTTGVNWGAARRR